MKKCLWIIAVIVIVNSLLSCIHNKNKSGSGSGAIVPLSTMEDVYNEVRRLLNTGLFLNILKPQR
jgi:hypothetical protein